MNLNQKELAKHLARALRKNQTGTEKMFWEIVRNRRFNNLKFNRQHIIYYEYFGELRFFIADFFCHEANLVIEIDGKIHLKQNDYDKAREEIIETMDLKIIRFINDAVKNNLENVKNELLEIFSNNVNQQQ